MSRGSSVVLLMASIEKADRTSAISGSLLIGYVMVRTRDHGDKWFVRFMETVLALPGVIELHRTTGDTDYMLKVVASDLASYNKIYRAISKLPDIAEVRSAFSMEAIKSTTELPLDI